MKLFSLVLVGLVGMQGCGHSAEVAVAETGPATTTGHVAASVNAKVEHALRGTMGMGTLELQEDPPISPTCKMTPLYLQEHRRFLAVDLNGDGEPEYFVEDMSGVHSLSFALMDSQGKLLMRQKDVDEMGGDRLLVLSSKHNGYFDLVSSSADLATVMGNQWAFNGKRYVRGRMFTYKNGPASKAFAFERTPGRVRESWYCDLWAIPPGMMDRMMEEYRKSLQSLHGNNTGG